jgi:SMC interacting uncharacterized protein involved in chromosome segregation
MIRRLLDYVFLVLMLLGVYMYRTNLEDIWSRAYNRYFPCRSPITYSLGDFDTRFGISKSDFLDAVSQAESIWEKNIGKNLFQYEDTGALKVNLVYDKRQAVTLELKNMGIEVTNSKSSYDSLKEKYNSLQSEYLNLRSQYDSKVSNFDSRRSAYEQEVNRVNSQGGADRKTVSRLNAERDSINAELEQIKQLQSKLNSKVDEVNAVATSLNDLAKSLNMTVDKYNTVGGTLGGEFEEGTYTEDSSGRNINVYQFENKTKLVRVLAHELGHALGLEHNNDSKAIMYRLNNGINEKLTTTDITDLKKLCGIK